MAANYKTITFRLDMNNPLDHRLYDVLVVQQTTSARNKLIKDVLIRSLVENTGTAVPEALTDNNEVKQILESISRRITALEDAAGNSSKPVSNDERKNPEEPIKILNSADPEGQIKILNFTAGESATISMPVMYEEPTSMPEINEEPTSMPEINEEPAVSQEALDFLTKGGFS
ncbi:MAG TPA: hypothetical protein DD634_01575 [Lachnospiraceae bacterium]|jgi:hypothetical protein|nr:hypothetical protein [Lachnospiraceae bacterium]HBW53809.1 hypothetical protein [Lachnospiraceae bacterium]